MQIFAAQTAAFIDEAETVRRLSPHTIDSYRRDLQILAGAGVAATQIGPEDIRRLLAREGKRGTSPASMSRRLSTWRMFFDYLRNKGALASNPARDVRGPRKEKRLPRAMTPDETAHFLDAPPPIANEWTTARDTAMFELLYSAGLRVGEMLALDIDDLDFCEGIARIRLGKGGRGRNTPFGERARTALQKWLALRQSTQTSAVFINRRGTRLNARTVQKRAAMRAAFAGCAGRVSPHVLRHSCASHFLQSSGDLRATQDLLGHADIASTEIYTRLDFQHLARTYDRAHPRARKSRITRKD